MGMFVPGHIYRIPYYVATSQDEKEALKFQKSEWTWEFRIPEGCPNACWIGDESVFPPEREVLMPPYTCIRVVKKTSKTIIVDVLDNKSVQEETKCVVFQITPKGSASVRSDVYLVGTGASSQQMKPFMKQFGDVLIPSTCYTSSSGAAGVVTEGANVQFLVEAAALSTEKSSKFGDVDADEHGTE